MLLEYPEELNISKWEGSDLIETYIEEKIIKGKITKPINLLSGKSSTIKSPTSPTSPTSTLTSPRKSPRKIKT